jgi:hypothetical protein
MADQEKNEKQIRREKKNEAFKALKEFFDKTPNEKCVEALKILRPSLYGLGGGRSGGSPAYLKVVNKIIESGNAGTNEMVLFKEFKIGRKETNGMIKRYLRNVEPKNRVWINFTPSDGLYKVIGKGEKAPDNYTGYVPVDEVTDLK